MLPDAIVKVNERLEEQEVLLGPVILMFLIVSDVTMFEMQEGIRGVIPNSWQYSVDPFDLIENYVKYTKNSII